MAFFTSTCAFGTYMHTNSLMFIMLLAPVTEGQKGYLYSLVDVIRSVHKRCPLSPMVMLISRGIQVLQLS